MTSTHEQTAIVAALRAILDDAVGAEHDPLWIVRREFIDAGQAALNGIGSVNTLSFRQADAAHAIMLRLVPLVADAAIVGRTYGWNDVLGVVEAAANRLETERVQLATVIATLRALSDKLDAISNDPQFQSMAVMSAIHGMSYSGPTWADELSAAKALLDANKK